MMKIISLFEKIIMKRYLDVPWALFSVDKDAAKKRFRKGSKYEEVDYDAYVETTMTQLRTLPPLTILEPQLGRNYGACPVFGAGDTTRLPAEVRRSSVGALRGHYGAATLTGVPDFYNTRPLGDQIAPVSQPPIPVTLSVSWFPFRHLKVTGLNLKYLSLIISTAIMVLTSEYANTILPLHHILGVIFAAWLLPSRICVAAPRTVGRRAQ